MWHCLPCSSNESCCRRPRAETHFPSVHQPPLLRGPHEHSHSSHVGWHLPPAGRDSRQSPCLLSKRLLCLRPTSDGLVLSYSLPGYQLGVIQTLLQPRGEKGIISPRCLRGNSSSCVFKNSFPEESRRAYILQADKSSAFLGL